MKKMFSLALALIMALALCIPTYATGTTETTDLTINSVNNPDASYEGYRLLGLTSALKCNEQHKHDTKDCYIYSYKVNSEYESILKNLLDITVADAGKTMDQTIMDAIAAKNTAAAIRDFAEDVLDAILAAKLDNDATMTAGVEAELIQGYWLIVDVTPDDKVEEGVVRSLVMLDTAGEPALSIEAKDEKEVLEKDVNDDDVFVNQTVNYTLSYTLPANLDVYEAYKFVITDTLSDGLTYNTDSCEIKIGAATVSAVEAEFDGQTMTIDLGAHILANKASYKGAEVVITYSAVVNDEAVIANTGNPNTAKLEFTNDPSVGGEGETSDDAVTSTYAIALKKVDVDGNPLADAEFQFPFYVKKNTTADGSYVYYGTYTDEEYAELSEDVKASITNILTTPASGEITVKGVASGTYSITEVKAPDGYNLLAAPVSVTAQKVTETKTEKTFYLDADGNVVAENGKTEVIYKNEGFYADAIVVVNKTGTELPSTGGVGTTIFYVVGGLMMAAAGVLLVTKKKVANEEE